MCARHEDKETHEEEEEEEKVDEKVSLSFFMPSDSASVTHVKNSCVFVHGSSFQQLLHQPEVMCTQTEGILPIHRQMSLFNQMVVVPTLSTTLTSATLSFFNQSVFSFKPPQHELYANNLEKKGTRF